AAVLRADGESQAIRRVFGAVHEADADPKLLAYQYLQALPEIAQGDSNKVWVIPAELSSAMSMLAGAFSGTPSAASEGKAPSTDGAAVKSPAAVPPAPAPTAD